MRVLIPAYEPAEHLPTLVAALRAADSSLGILVVDDGSGPAFADTFALVASYGAEILRHDRNRGKGAALKTGFAPVHGAYPREGVVTADADGQHMVHDILAVVSRVRESDEVAGATLVLGCRSFTGSVPIRSRFGNNVSRRLFRLAAGWSRSDTQTGLRGCSAEIISWLLTVSGDRFEYEQRLLLGLRRAGFTAVEVPIETVYLSDNKSSHFRPVLDSVRIMLPTILFAMSSLFGFFIDTIALFVLQALTGALVPSIVVARLLSASANFVMNRRVVFLRRGHAGLARQIFRYAMLAGVLLVSNIVWISYLTGIGVPLWVAKLVTELVLFVTSYRVQRSVVFGSASSAPHPRLGAIPKASVASSGASQVGK